MGTTPSKPPATPPRPFDRQQRRVCLTNAFIPKARKDVPSVLLQLIACREWQKVLIRISLVPSEITQPQKMSWYGVQWSLLPLHLACALQPPKQVIAMLLHSNADTARVCMTRSAVKSKKGFLLRGKKKNKPFIHVTTREYVALDLQKNDTAPSSDSEGHVQQHNVTHLCPSMDSEDDDEHGLLPEEDAQEEREFALKRDTLSRVLRTSEDSIFLVFEPSETTDSDSEADSNSRPIKYEDNQVSSFGDKAAETSKDDLQEYLGTNGMVLQLGYDGTLESRYDGTLESLSTGSLPSQPTRMQWDLDPLLIEADALLPLHIACLYRAAPQVIALLLDAYMEGVAESALGMLPIHIACARFELPPPVVAPPSQVPFPIEDEFDLAKSLAYLVKAFPESLDFHSENNGMTPKMYIEETMDDESYANECLQVLGVTFSKENSLSEHDDTAGSSSTPRKPIPTEVHCKDGMSSNLPSILTQLSSRYLGEFSPQINQESGTPLYAKMAAKEWQAALDMIEEHSIHGSEWQYGIERDHSESHGNPKLWKRLPIHSACVLGAPIGVVEALHLAYPMGVVTKEPFTGALPLHLACCHSAPPDLVKGLLLAYPIGARVIDGLGRLALHQACLSGAPHLTFIYLLKAYPHAVLLKDDKSRTPLQYAKTNPAVKRATVELLELVLYFLEKRPTIEDDYKFSGFHSPRQIQRGSVLSGFFEEDESVIGTSQPCADEDLNNMVLIGPEAPREKEGEHQCGYDGHLEKLTRVRISDTHTGSGQRESFICLDGVPRSVASFPESTTTADNEVIPWDPIFCSALEDEGVDILSDSVAMHTEESDDEAWGAHLNSEGVRSSTVQDPNIHSTTSSGELLATEGSVTDDQVIEADRAAGYDGWSSCVSAAADQGTKKAGEPAVGIASNDDESRSSKNAAVSKISWLEGRLLARVANAHELAEPVESVTADAGNALRDKHVDDHSFSSIGSDQTIWHCNSQSSKSSPLPVGNERNDPFTNESVQAAMIARPKISFPLDTCVIVNQLDKTDASSNEPRKAMTRRRVLI